MLYDRERLLQAADSLDVAEYIGLDIKRIGSNYSILCPGHEKRLGKPDTGFGNCILTKNGYTCFACGKSVNLIDMVMEVTGCNYYEALGTIAETCGGRELYLSDDSDIVEKEELPLMKEELASIGLKSHSTPIYDIRNLMTCEYDDEDELYSKQSHYYISGNEVLKETLLGVPCSISLFSLYKDDREAYNYLIETKARESFEDSKNALAALQNDNSFLYDISSFLNFDKNAEEDLLAEPELIYHEMLSYYQKKYMVAKQILSQYEDDNIKNAPPSFEVFRVVSSSDDDEPF